MLDRPHLQTIANMAPEYGATMGFFPVDKRTMEYLHQTSRDQDTVAFIEAYLKAQGLFVEYDQVCHVWSCDVMLVQPSSV